jgi:hypothetical protein
MWTKDCVGLSPGEASGEGSMLRLRGLEKAVETRREGLAVLLYWRSSWLSATTFSLMKRRI